MAGFRKIAITRDNYEECGLSLVNQGKPSRAFLFKVLSMSHCLCMAWPTFVTKHLLYPSSCELSSFWRHPSPSPYLIMTYKPQLPIRKPLMSLWGSHMYKICFSPADLSCQFKQPKLLEGKSSSSHTNT